MSRWPLLADPTSEEKRLLGAFHYQKNIALLHMDASVMPKTRGCWSSWNYRTEGQTASTIYWMNSLQGVSDQADYFVSINAISGEYERGENPEEIVYQHPIFSVEATMSRIGLSRLNQNGPVYFCGSYFRYGFHEDALVSALDVVNGITGRTA